jgi:acylphosphatase
MQHHKVIVTGKVQGVYFRDTARREANKLGLSGFARNEPDGSVYIEVEGPTDQLQQFLAWCHEGSRQAEVESVIHTQHSPIGHVEFQIY